MSIVRLAADEPDTADRELRQTMSQWSREGYHVQHNDALWAAVQIELYRGDGTAAWSLIDQSWPALAPVVALAGPVHSNVDDTSSAPAPHWPRRSRVRRSRPAEARSLLAVARRAARRLERERMPCPTAYARLIRGALAAIGGDSARAVSLLTEAVACFEAVDMRLCAAATRRRLGELQGGASGQAEIDRAASLDGRREDQESRSMAAMIITPWPMSGPRPRAGVVEIARPPIAARDPSGGHFQPRSSRRLPGPEVDRQAGQRAGQHGGHAQRPEHGQVVHVGDTSFSLPLRLWFISHPVHVYLVIAGRDRTKAETAFWPFRSKSETDLRVRSTCGWRYPSREGRASARFRGLHGRFPMMWFYCLMVALGNSGARSGGSDRLDEAGRRGRETSGVRPRPVPGRRDNFHRCRRTR